MSRADGCTASTTSSIIHKALARLYQGEANVFNEMTGWPVLAPTRGDAYLANRRAATPQPRLVSLCRVSSLLLKQRTCCQGSYFELPQPGSRKPFTVDKLP